MDEGFAVAVAAGTLRESVRADTLLPHRWTDGGVAVDVEFSGAHLLHLATAGCVLNDVYREAAALSMSIDGVLVRASGDFDPDTWRSRGITYQIDIDSPAHASDITLLLQRVEEVAEIPRALRAGASVNRIGSG